MANSRKKTPKKSSQAPKAPIDPIEISQSKHDIDELAGTHEHPGSEARSWLLAGRTEGELIDLGRSYSTEDILHSVPAFVSSIAEQSISPEQRAFLVGYSPEKLALLIHEAIALRSIHQAFKQRRATANAARRRSQLRGSMSQGVVLRNTVQRALEEVVPHDHAERSALEAARGTAETGGDLTQSLRALAGVVTRVRAGASSGVRSLFDSLGLGEALVAELTSTADRIEADEKLALGSTGTRLTQRQLDYQDGIVLTLVSSLWRAFQLGHVHSPALVVPPLGRMARLANARPKRAAGEPVTPVEPSEPAPTS